MPRPMTLAAWLLLTTVATAAEPADAPDFHKNAFTFGLDYGYGIWQLDRSRLESQVGAPGDVFVNEAQNTQTANVRVGFNILGYATVEADLTGTGWNLGGSNRGGGGFLVGGAAWHPLRLFVESPTRPYDASLFVGLGYGITGQDTGMDGFIWELGLRGSYFFNRWFGVTAYARWVFLNWSTFYLDYNHRDLPGASAPLPQGSGGDFFTLGLGVELRLIP